MGYLGLGKGLFAVENKNNQALFFEEVPFDPELFGRLNEKALSILRSPGPPERDNSDFGWCDWQAGNICPWVGSGPGLCMNCGWYLQEYDMAEGGIRASGDMCLKHREATRRFWHCTSFSAR
jgi:hypothetical protein